jgi:hypothetical protein
MIDFCRNLYAPYFSRPICLNDAVIGQAQSHHLLPLQYRSNKYRANTREVSVAT